jgi:hypothetical protein
VSDVAVAVAAVLAAVSPVEDAVAGTVVVLTAAAVAAVESTVALRSLPQALATRASAVQAAMNRTVVLLRIKISRTDDWSRDRNSF